MVSADFDREFLARAGGAVAASTVVLTASFVGVVAFFTGSANGVGGRLPFYVLTMAVAFAATIFALDDPEADGSRVISATAGVTVASFVLVTLAGEGFVYAVRFPGKVLASNLLVYFAAAGLICTGLAYWALRHWREFTVDSAAEAEAGADAE
ncbi:hypothetical protein [Halorussus halophilus]|uniref:hypothetical protein n=1 Tax=Halorussus halophilus TaxID=2650975 RepID=UPI001300FF63|nr:hypothetical protein [Halorussus halophilus]